VDISERTSQDGCQVPVVHVRKLRGFDPSTRHVCEKGTNKNNNEQMIIPVNRLVLQL
jgi:hypothetical protein